MLSSQTLLGHGMDTTEGPEWAHAWLVWPCDLEKAAFVHFLGRPVWSMEWDLGAVLNSCPREGCVSPVSEETHPLSSEPSGQLGADLTPHCSQEPFKALRGAQGCETTTLCHTEGVIAGKTSSPSSTKVSKSSS